MNKIPYLGFILIFLVLSCCKSPNLENIIGVYINCNYEQSSHIGDIPFKEDTLILYKDRTFKSGYYGKGIYELDNDNIILNYKYEYGEASSEMPIEVNIFGEFKFIIYKDLNHHYKKIE